VSIRSNKAILFTSLLLLAGYLLVRFTQPSSKGNPQTVDFNWHVRPILSDRCFKCHGPDEKKREAGLRLDTEEGAFAALGKGKDHYAIVAGHPEKSTLIQRIYSTNPDSVMPAPDSHLSLSEQEKEILKKWIGQGAHWKKHWAFILPEKAPVPEVEEKKKVRNEIDAFVARKLEDEGLEFTPDADKERLIRRVSFDLTGLPPEKRLLDRYLSDNNSDAYEKAVDSLLASPAYGERWTMLWLDLARYSDTHGYQDDLPRTMWPWRDWVIHAFNQNLPYDQFVTQQLAGDLLPNATKDQLLASAFNRNHKITQEGGVIDEEYRVEYVTDRTNTFGKAFLGLTFECAHCHDHKYDPISMRDYYSTFAFFNQVNEKGFVPNLKTPAPYMPISQEDITGVLSFINAKSVIRSEKDTILQMIMQDSAAGGRKTFILNRGQYSQPTVEVSQNAPAAILPFDTTALPPNRLGLAQWLFDSRNPLTARVAVNRFWQEIFGRGIVFTSDNFGTQGALPTHPELLDWLAVDFMEHRWDLKRLLRQMVTSTTYRQSSVCSTALRERDPDNTLLARGGHYRLPYEFIRDNVLVSAGLLVREIGGPSVRPLQPPGLWEEIGTEKSANNFRGEFTYVPDTLPEKRYRRSLYSYNKRTIPPPAHIMFDAPMRDNCEVRRNRTSTPLQALNLLNDPQILEASRALAQQLLEKPEKEEARIELAFYCITGRKPVSRELSALAGLFREEQSRYQKQPDLARKLLSAGRYPQAKNADPNTLAALMLTVSTIFNLDEAISKT
jgi:hypothetical protein